MKRSNRLVILVGVLLAVLAFVGIVILLNGPRPGGSTTAPTTVQVMVARDNIAIGDPCVADSVEPRQVNADAVVQTRIPDASMLTGRPALVAITAGQQVTQEACGLVGVGVSSIEQSLDPLRCPVDRPTARPSEKPLCHRMISSCAVT